MPTRTKKEKLDRFRSELIIRLVGCLRALSLYPEDHPEARKKTESLFTLLERYLEQRPAVTLLFINREVVVENTPLPELGDRLHQLMERFAAMKFQRLIFRSGLSRDELVFFLQLLVPLLKHPESADLALARNHDRLPHVLAGSLPVDAGNGISYQEAADAIRSTGGSMLSVSGRIKDIFTDLEGPLSDGQVALAKETTNTIGRMIATGEMPIKILIYRRSADPDPYIHALNVAALSMSLARRLGLEDAWIQDMGLSGLLHDIGHHFSTRITLSRSQAVTLDEKKRQWEHPIRGAEILLTSPGMPDAVPLAAYEHHLRYDGGGYPLQEHPRDLNLAGMIVCVTNTYDNLRRRKPGRNAVSLTDALNWMDRHAASHFHPLVYRHFRELVKAQASEEA